jgi:hypothetical protein
MRVALIDLPTAIQEARIAQGAQGKGSVNGCF